MLAWTQPASPWTGSRIVDNWSMYSEMSRTGGQSSCFDFTTRPTLVFEVVILYAGTASRLDIDAIPLEGKVLKFEHYMTVGTFTPVMVRQVQLAEAHLIRCK